MARKKRRKSRRRVKRRRNPTTRRRSRSRRNPSWSRNAKKRVKRLGKIRRRRRKSNFKGWSGFPRGMISRMWAILTGLPKQRKLFKKMAGRIRRSQTRATGRTKAGYKRRGSRPKKNLSKRQRRELTEARKFFKTGIAPDGSVHSEAANYGGPGGGALLVAAKRKRKRRRNPTTRRRSRRRVKRRRNPTRRRRGRRRVKRARRTRRSRRR